MNLFNFMVRSRSPLRLGIAGGGSDVSPYSDQYGGQVLNVTIDLYAYCTIQLVDEPIVEFVAMDLGMSYSGSATSNISLDGRLNLHKAVYNRIVRQFQGGSPFGVRILTYSDAPPGSGLGSSSSMVVAIIVAFREAFMLPLGDYDVAHLAYEIERVDCALAGGKQDQYAATFGGFNFMEFYSGDRVVVNPLRVSRHIENELKCRLMLFFTGVSRDSARIIEDQILNTNRLEGGVSLESMHEIKRNALDLKERLLKGDLDGVAELFQASWEAKKRLSAAISNPHIESAADTALNAGANAIKVSGAGGGGFMMILADPEVHPTINRALAQLGGYCQKFQFTHFGAEAWVVKKGGRLL